MNDIYVIDGIPALVNDIVKNNSILDCYLHYNDTPKQNTTYFCGDVYKKIHNTFLMNNVVKYFITGFEYITYIGGCNHIKRDIIKFTTEIMKSEKNIVF